MNAHHGALAPIILLAAAAAASPAAAQERETRPLRGFNAVEVGGGIDLSLHQGAEFVVVVEAEGDVADVVTEVRGTTLEIRRKSSFNFFDWSGDAGSVDVTLPLLVSLTASGGSDVETAGTFTSDRLKIVASGGSEVEIDVAAGTLEAQASGGSDLTLSGSARSVKLRSSGGSDLNASRLTADEAEVHGSGGSDLSIAVRERIVGDASGGSDIIYSGNPQTVDVDTSGGSDVRRR